MRRNHHLALQTRLRQHVYVLAELIGERNTAHPSALDAARAYISGELRGMGYEIDRQEFPVTRRSGVNLAVVGRAAGKNAGTLVIGAHYDTVAGSPGADDNASSVAILLEIARSLRGHALRRTVRCVFFDCEEPPHFLMGEMGSERHARALRESGEPVLGMVCLESLGYFPARHSTEAIGPCHLRLLTRLAGRTGVVIVSHVRSITFGLPFVWAFLRSGWFRFLPAAVPRRLIPTIELSDHRSYWDEGFPALMVTDTAFLRNPNYHQPTDRLATLNLERMAALCDVLARCILGLVHGFSRSGARESR